MHINKGNANGFEPYAWLCHVLTELPKLEKGATIDHLLPVKLPSEEAKSAT